jgi:hypothetical protein
LFLLIWVQNFKMVTKNMYEVPLQSVLTDLHKSEFQNGCRISRWLQKTCMRYSLTWFLICWLLFFFYTFDLISKAAKLLYFVFLFSCLLWRSWDKKVISRQKEEEFIDLINDLIKFGMRMLLNSWVTCSEHGQRLLIYEYCGGWAL